MGWVVAAGTRGGDLEQEGHDLACLSHTGLNSGREPWRNWDDTVAGSADQRPEFGSPPAWGATFSDPDLGHLKSNGPHGSGLSFGALLDAKPWLRPDLCYLFKLQTRPRG